MSKHTPEPWIATPVGDKHSDDGPDFWLIDAVPVPNQETAVAELCHKPGDRAEANAYRIVACVNACTGIPTEALKEGAVLELVNAVEDYMTNEDHEFAWNEMKAALASFTKEEGGACPACGGKRVVRDGAHYSGLGKDFGGMYCPTCVAKEEG